MTDRRIFLKGSFAVAAAFAASPSLLQAAEQEPTYTNIIYTADNPGKWTGKAGSHAPVVTVDNLSIKVETKHGMSPKHFIVRHTLVLEDGTVVGAKVFSPADIPLSNYSLPTGYKGKVYATSFCNLHDFWLTTFVI